MAMMSLQQAMDLAERHRQGGRVAEAEGICRQILAAQPEEIGARHLLIRIAFESNRHELAAEQLAELLRRQRSDASLWCNYGTALANLRRFSEALTAFRQAATLQPDSPDIRNNLGNCLEALGRLDEAIEAWNQALALRPRDFDARMNLARGLEARGRIDEAIRRAREAVSLYPDRPEAHHALGILLRQNGDLEPAIRELREAIRLRPDMVEAINLLGVALYDIGLLPEAVETLRRAIAIRPSYVAPYNNLGIVLRELGEADEALAVFDRSQEMRPDHPEGLCNRALALQEKGLLSEAIAAFDRAIALRPEYVEAHNNRANALKEAGRIDEALVSYRRAAEIGKESWIVSNLLFALHAHPDYGPRELLEEHLAWNRDYARPLKPARIAHDNDLSPERTLRVGFVSSDLTAHPVGRFLLPLLIHFDRSRVQVFCYSDVRRSDETTERLRAQTAGWRRIAGMPDAQVCDQIVRDRIDILIDLALHTRGNRLPVFARKPAPVQVTWLGYCGTTGLETMDYRLTDPLLDPVGGDDSVYTEKSVRLPRTWWCYQPPTEAGEIGPPPAPNGAITFGCLNAFSKINARVLETWGELLRQTPGSTLLLHSREGEHRATVESILAARGVTPDRIRHVGRVSGADYFRQYHQIDIALDPFPYPGGTTTCDALWMGVPVVSLAGRTAVSRVGRSILSGIGLPELVADSIDRYIAIAVELARDLARLRALHSTLRVRMRTAPLMDAPGFARDMEAALREMWRTWCRDRNSPSGLSR